MWKVVYPDELYHHGVKGQQWGVRRGPPYPIEDKVMPKGTKLASVSARYYNPDDYRKNGRWMYTYNPDDDWDSKVYKGPFVRFLVGNGAKFIFEHRFETVKDLTMPTRKEREQEFKDLYNDPKWKKIVAKDLKQYRDRVLMYNAGAPAYLNQIKKLNLKKLSTAEEYKIAYKLFNQEMEAMHAHRSTKEYASRMGKKYDAMVDDNNQGVYNEVHDPVIIFKAHEALKPIADTPVRMLTVQEAVKNYMEVEKEMNKKGKAIML